MQILSNYCFITLYRLYYWFIVIFIMFIFCKLCKLLPVKPEVKLKQSYREYPKSIAFDPGTNPIGQRKPMSNETLKEIILEKSDDMTPVIFQALENCTDDAVIRLPQGEYHFYPDEAFEKYYFISNNRHGLKRIAFPIIGKKNLTFDGGGSRLVFHGEIVPFVIEGSSHVTLMNFSIDWKRPFYSQGIISAVDDGGVEVEIDRETYPYHFEDGQILFDGEGWSHPFNEGVFEVDIKTGGPAYLSGDNFGFMDRPPLHVSPAGENRIRFNNRFPHRPTLGNILLLRHYPRLCPGIHIKQSGEVLIERVELNHCGGMGIIAQFSENIHLNQFTVRPTPGTDRLFSVTVDAAHFVNCRGLIRIEDSFFSNQMDDPANVHGINTRIKERRDATSVIAELVHAEQRGVEIAFPGDTMGFAHNNDLLTYATGTIRAIEPIDARYSRLVFTEKLPDALRPGDVIDNHSWTADVHISECTSCNNRARGYLISTPGKVLIENNRIASAGAGIKIGGDANYWFESGAVRDVTIRNNVFGDCCYGVAPWGRAVIEIDPEISNPWNNAACFHRNIRIENNVFRTFDPGILYARSVDGIVFSGNTIEPTRTYPEIGRMDAQITLDACRNAEVCNNQTTGRQPSIEINKAFHTRHRLKQQTSLAPPSRRESTAPGTIIELQPVPDH